MKIRVSIAILSVFITNFALSQIQNTNQIIDSSKKKLKELVGEELFKFYTLEKESQYQIKKKNGKTKWKLLKPNQIINNNFQQAQIQFYFKHPDFNYSTLRTTYIKLDKNINLTNKPFIEFIPEFIKYKDSKKWLSESEIDKIIKNLEFKTSSYKKFKQLIFNNKTNSYYWEITNTLFEEPKHSKVEIYELSPIDGKVLSRYEEDQYTY
jgi:hypothetical protein